MDLVDEECVKSATKILKQQTNLPIFAISAAQTKNIYQLLTYLAQVIFDN
jgi:ethanolamine utilization protein EutP (predicted NTPase)